MKLIIGIIIGFFIATTINAYAFRMAKPPIIREWNQNTFTQLNNTLEELWNLTNGRYSPTSGADASTGTGTVKMGTVNNANSTGWFKIELSDGTVKYVPYWDDDTP